MHNSRTELIVRKIAAAVAKNRCLVIRENVISYSDSATPAIHLNNAVLAQHNLYAAIAFQSPGFNAASIIIEINCIP
ncbi:MAG: hypothetical protein PUP91_09785 [Rhizonema sp. PD37]|nr:hypothetical protein [Rhizonema sp. PD37]